MAKKTPVVGFAFASSRCLLGGLFAFSGYLKVLDPAGFALTVDNYHLLPALAARVLAVYLPWLEIICGVAVLTRWCLRGALLVLMILCGVFCAALAAAWFRGLDIECGCFGRVMTTGPLLGIVRDLGLGFVALLLFRREDCAGDESPQDRV